MAEKKVPEFSNVDEMARFWDTHDSTEFEGEIEEVEYSPKRLVLSVRFDLGDMIALSRKAKQLGLDRSTFVRYVVKQYLGSSTDEEAAATQITSALEQRPSHDRL